jgi:hypothetical protein
LELHHKTLCYFRGRHWSQQGISLNFLGRWSTNQQICHHSKWKIFLDSVGWKPKKIGLHLEELSIQFRFVFFFIKNLDLHKCLLCIYVFVREFSNTIKHASNEFMSQTFTFYFFSIWYCTKTNCSKYIYIYIYIEMNQRSLKLNSQKTWRVQNMAWF